MNKILRLSFVLLTICLMMTACGGLKEKTITVSDVSISGEADNYIKVVDGDYILKPGDGTVTIAVKFELIKQYNGSKGDHIGDMNLVPLDNSGVAIPDIGLNFSPATMGDWDKIKSLLKSEVGKTVIVSFEWNYFRKKDIQAKIMKGTSNFEIVRADFTGTKSNSSSYASYDDDTNDSSISSNDDDWDAILKSYEAFIDKYISLMKKASNGDMSALEEYPEYMEKAMVLADKLGNAGGDLSSAQAAKFVKLQTKLANAAANM
jgi:hypothetical protein